MAFGRDAATGDRVWSGSAPAPASALAVIPQRTHWISSNSKATVAVSGQYLARRPSGESKSVGCCQLFSFFLLFAARLSFPRRACGRACVSSESPASCLLKIACDLRRLPCVFQSCALSDSHDRYRHSTVNILVQRAVRRNPKPRCGCQSSGSSSIAQWSQFSLHTPAQRSV